MAYYVRSKSCIDKKWGYILTPFETLSEAQEMLEKCVALKLKHGLPIGHTLCKGERTETSAHIETSRVYNRRPYTWDAEIVDFMPVRRYYPCANAEPTIHGDITAAVPFDTAKEALGQFETWSANYAITNAWIDVYETRKDGSTEKVDRIEVVRTWSVKKGETT